MGKCDIRTRFSQGEFLVGIVEFCLARLHVFTTHANAGRELCAKRMNEHQQG